MANLLRSNISRSVLGLVILVTLFVPILNDAKSQAQFPDSIFVSSNHQTQIHELVLKATQDPSTGQTSKASGFNMDLSNVFSSPVGSQISVFSTDRSLSIVEAKLRTAATSTTAITTTTPTPPTSNTESNANQFLELPKVNTNSFTLAGFSQGVYTLDIITQKGNTKAAYEGLLVIQQAGQTAIPPQMQQIIQQQITSVDTDIDLRFVFRKAGIDKERVCLFTPNHPICAPDKDGRCPEGWSMNEDGQCFPYSKKCPPGYWRADDDETGACVPVPEPEPTPEPEPIICPTGTEVSSSEEDCPPVIPPDSDCPEGTVPSPGGGCQPFMPSTGPGPEPRPGEGEGEGEGGGDDTDNGSSGDKGGSSENGESGGGEEDEGGDSSDSGEGGPSLFN